MNTVAPWVREEIKRQADRAKHVADTPAVEESQLPRLSTLLFGAFGLSLLTAYAIGLALV